MVDGKKTNEEMFADWLAENIPYTRLPELYLCYSEIEAYCLKTKVLHKQLFETTDLNTVKRVQKTVTENRYRKPYISTFAQKADEKDSCCGTVLHCVCENVR